MISVTKFLEENLKLKVNKEKSTVGRPWKLKFLGFSFYFKKDGAGIRIHEKSVRKFMEKVREITSRSNGKSIAWRMDKLRQSITGWVNYFGMADIKGIAQKLDEWIRRRIRMCFWKQWKKIKTKHDNLVKFGIDNSKAWEFANTRKSYWHTANSPILATTITNEYLKRIGFQSILERYDDKLMNIKSVSRREIFYSMLVIMPAMVLFLAFTYFPLLMTIKYSATNWNGYSKRYDYTGITNFINIFKEGDVIISFWNTIYLAILSIVVGTILQIVLALILYENIKGRNIFKAIFYVPCVISQMIVSLTWLGFFQYTGIINEFLKILHLKWLIADWLGNPHIVKNTLIFINTWQWVGYGMVIYLTGLNSIPVDVYEASTLDGAIGFKKFRYVTLPLLMPAITVTMFISITGALRIFDLPYVMTNGGPMNASITVSMIIYNNAFLNERFGYASSIGLVFFILIATITIIQLRVTRKMEVEY